MSLLPVTAGLTLDLRAIGLTPAYQGVIGGWPDSSGQHQVGYFTNRLATLLSLQTPAGGPAVHFDGSCPLAFEPGAFDGTTNPFATATAGVEIFAVVRATPVLLGGQPRPVDPANNYYGGNYGFYAAGGGGYGYYPAAATSYASFADGFRQVGVDGAIVDGAFCDRLLTIAGVSTDQWHIYNVYHDGGARVTSVDGTVVNTYPGAYTQPGGLILGSGLYDWYGDVAEFICFDRALSPAERAQMLAYLTDLHFTAHPPDPGDPDPSVPVGPGGLTLMSTVSDTFDAATVDPMWYADPNYQYVMTGSHLEMNGVLQTASSGYNIDSAYVKLTLAPRDPGDDSYAQFFASVPFGSPPANWGITIHVNDTASELTATWTNDDGTGNSTATLTYDPVAHAYLRLSSAFAQVGSDWFITMLCEAGPAPGQWTTLIHSPQMYSSQVTDGFQLQFQGYRYTAQGGPTPPLAIYLDDFNVAPAASDLWMKMPDGAYRKVGVSGQPLSLRLPDGSLRTWPGAGLPMYMKQSDGTWKKVLA